MENERLKKLIGAVRKAGFCVMSYSPEVKNAQDDRHRLGLEAESEEALRDGIGPLVDALESEGWRIDAFEFRRSSFEYGGYTLHIAPIVTASP